MIPVILVHVRENCMQSILAHLEKSAAVAAAMAAEARGELG